METEFTQEILILQYLPNFPHTNWSPNYLWIGIATFISILKHCNQEACWSINQLPTYQQLSYFQITSCTQTAFNRKEAMKRTLSELSDVEKKSVSQSINAGHSNAVFDLSLGIVTAAYAFEAYKDPVRHQFCSLHSETFIQWLWHIALKSLKWMTCEVALEEDAKKSPSSVSTFTSHPVLL